ncbi:hypothetical protein NM208_g16231 [Fusarium decemcellulare]|uniref:Uncharacterized protein n=1 Tax=Fusarium decemcellulare TaxID=57161 RepID=A0ACC1RCM5_9HYPO|nr:hypothetical protein NM208_g16231 [Fusarium decemcellulare]
MDRLKGIGQIRDVKGSTSQPSFTLGYRNICQVPSIIPKLLQQRRRYVFNARRFAQLLLSKVVAGFPLLFGPSLVLVALSPIRDTYLARFVRDRGDLGILASWRKRANMVNEPKGRVAGLMSKGAPRKTRQETTSDQPVRSLVCITGLGDGMVAAAWILLQASSIKLDPLRASALPLSFLSRGRGRCNRSHRHGRPLTQFFHRCLDQLTLRLPLMTRSPIEHVSTEAVDGMAHAPSDLPRSPRSSSF